MKRLLLIVAVAGFLAAAPLSHLVTAAPKEEAKINICHVTGTGFTIGEGETLETFVGHVISVSVNALSAHCDHGDHHPVASRVRGDNCGRVIGNGRCGGGPAVDPHWYHEE